VYISLENAACHDRLAVSRLGRRRCAKALRVGHGKGCDMESSLRLLASMAGIPLIAAAAVAQRVAWNQLLVGGPSAREGAAMAYDSTRFVNVLFGGVGPQCGPQGYCSDTWEWNGYGWSQRPAAGPEPREWSAMAYDSARRLTVLYGGFVTFGSTHGPANDTWEWDGTAWTRRTVIGPGSGYGASMAYDPSRGVTVLFGGYNNARFSGETYEWNGSTWTLRATTGPSPRLYAPMAYDSGRGVMVLFGGTNFFTDSAETWEWDGSAWAQRWSLGPLSDTWHQWRSMPGVA
jgi:hypothetical protein